MTRTALEPKTFRDRRPAFADGSDTPRDFLERCLARIDAIEDGVQAFTTLDREGARAAADAATLRYREGRQLSALDGCPVGVKDIIETADMPTGFGSPAFAGTETRRDAAPVQALRAGGAIMLGKTVTTEFAIGFSGKTVNPHDAERTPGGSSSGSAAAVGSGMLPLALGTQTNGSVLRPASYTGILGFKGSFGALPIAGVHPVSQSHDHLGVFANTLDDMWAAASQMARAVGSPGHPPLQRAGETAPEPARPRRLVRLHLAAWEEIADPHRAEVEREIARLAARGVEIVDRDSDPRVAALEELLDREVGGSADIVAYDMRWPFTGYVERFGEVIGERIRGIVERSPAITPETYAALLERRRAAQTATATLLDAVAADGFVFPAASGPPPKGFAYTGSRAHLVYWSWLGFPSVSLPVMEADGLPWGLQLAHLHGRDGDLCAAARWLLESAQDRDG